MDSARNTVGGPVVDVLSRYEPAGPAEAADARRVRELAAGGGDPWLRSTPLHTTASALIVHPPTGRVLLRRHPRQRSWLQVGGHGDPGESDPASIALREAVEETGLGDLKPWPDASLLQVVIVPVAAGRGEPAHEHADLRFVFATDAPGAARPENPEAPLRWLTVAEALEIAAEANVREALRRVARLLDQGGPAPAGGPATRL